MSQADPRVARTTPCVRPSQRRSRACGVQLVRSVSSLGNDPNGAQKWPGIGRLCPKCSTDAGVMIANKLKRGLQLAKRREFQREVSVFNGGQIGPNDWRVRCTRTNSHLSFHASDARQPSQREFLTSPSVSSIKDRGQLFLQPFPCKVLQRNAMARTEREDLRYLLRR